MADDLISSFISSEGKKELIDAINSLQKMQETIVSINKNQINFESATSGAKTLKDYKTGYDSLSKSQEDFARTLDALKQIQDETAKNIARNTALTYDEAKALAASKVALSELNKELIAEAQAQNESYQNRVKSVAATRAATQAKKEDAAAQAAWNKQIAEGEKRAAAMDAEIGKKQVQALKDATKAKIDDAKASAYASNSYKQLSDAYKEAKLRASNYAIDLGAAHPITIQAQTDAAALGNQLKTLDKAVGDNTRNVGNYGSAFTKAWGFIRQAAYILPGIGIAGIFNVIGEAILFVIEKISDYIGSANKMKLANEELVKGLQSSEYKKAAKNISELTINVELAKEGFIDKNKVVNEYNKTMGLTTGTVKTLSQVEAKLVEDAPAYLNMMLMKASASAALQEAAKKQIESEIEFNKITSGESGWKDKLLGYISTANAPAMSPDQATKMFELLRARDAQKRADALEKIASDFQRKAAEIAKKYKFDLFGGTEDDKKTSTQDLTNARLEARKQEIEADSELDKQQVEQDARNQQAIFNNEKESLERRLEANGKYQSDLEEILNTETNKQEDEIRLKLAKIEEIETKSADKRTSEEKKLLLFKTALQKQLLLQEETSATKRNDIIRDASDREKKIIDDYSKKLAQSILSGLNDIERDVQLSQENELSELIDSLNKRQITYEEYQKQKKAITDKYGLETLSKEKQLLKDSLSDAGLQPTEIKTIQEKITDIERKQSQERIAISEDEARKKSENYKILYDKIKAAAEAGLSAIKEISENITEGQINDLEKQGEEIDKNKDKTIASINLQAASEEEKQKRIAAAEALANAKHEEIDVRKRAALRRQAQLEKQLSILSIIASTAEAIAKDLKLPAAVKFVAIAADAAIGAAQLVSVISRPIPAYAKGVDSSPEGFAKVGEQGTEMMIDKNGKISFTPNTETVKWLNKGTTVIPHEKTMDIMRMSMFKSFPLMERQRFSNDDVVSELKGQTQAIVKAIAKKQFPQFVGSNKPKNYH